MTKPSNFTKDELSLLLFFECAVVDYGGLLCAAHMNQDDHAIADRWNASGFVKFERVYSKHLISKELGRNHCVWLSDDAMNAAHQERKARAERCRERRRRLTVSEHRALAVAEVTDTIVKRIPRPR